MWAFLENFSALYANPTRFLALAKYLHAPLWASSLLVLAIGLFWVSYVPDDYQQGAAVRIMFVHVPSAWMALFGFSFIFFASLWALVFRHPLGFVVARAAAPVGAVFTLLALLTGALWGQPMWGTWWVWDARLTSVLVLFFIYLGYIALWQVIDDIGQAARITSIFAMVGFVNVPIVKFSVDWWNTLHQPASVLRLGGSALHNDFLYPLLFMGLGFTLLFFALTLTRTQTHLHRQRLRVRRQQAGENANV